jgi:L-lactate permease
MWANFALGLFSLCATCVALRVAMLWRTRHDKWKQGAAGHEEWKRRTRQQQEWKQRFVVAAILFFVLAVAVLIWPLIAKK